ncbi:uncharacterized protein C22orf15 [Centroberyx affinis]|uniref:uncharacterized protein C22orf15 n=1 Tax=Centroberyx affinis TaxID=166261 RepID=UPI003A5C1771
MFVTVLFGDSRMELFNLNCKLINFIHSLKERCGLDVKDCVDLMDSSGTVMNLEEKQHSVDLASSLLGERQHYVLLRVCRGDNNEGQKYVSLLNNLSQSHPELTDMLRKISNPDRERERKAGSQRRGWTQRDSSASQTRSKNKKSHQIK